MNNDEILVSIMTSTFNRADRLPRLFESIKKLTHKNIEYIIVDGGSSDNTKDVVEAFKKEVAFPVTYIYKKCYKHEAMNILFSIARGHYGVIIDDDDELLPNSISQLLSIFTSLPNKDDYCAVVGRVISSADNKGNGPLYPNDINILPWKKSLKIAQKTPGEKFSLQNLDIYRQFIMPVPEGVKPVTESILWNEVLSKYREYYTNIPVRIYHQFEETNSLGSPKKDYMWMKVLYFDSIYRLNNKNKYTKFQYMNRSARIRYCVSRAFVTKEDRQKLGYLKSLSDKFICVLLFPITFIAKIKFRDAKKH